MAFHTTEDTHSNLASTCSKMRGSPRHQSRSVHRKASDATPSLPSRSQSGVRLSEPPPRKHRSMIMIRTHDENISSSAPIVIDEMPIPLKHHSNNKMKKIQDHDDAMLLSPTNKSPSKTKHSRRPKLKRRGSVTKFNLEKDVLSHLQREDEFEFVEDLLPHRPQSCRMMNRSILPDGVSSPVNTPKSMRSMRSVKMDGLGLSQHRPRLNARRGSVTKFNLDEDDGCNSIRRIQLLDDHDDKLLDISTSSEDEELISPIIRKPKAFRRINVEVSNDEDYSLPSGMRRSPKKSVRATFGQQTTSQSSSFRFHKSPKAKISFGRAA